MTMPILSPRGIMIEWAAGRMSWRDATRRLGIDTMGELYRAVSDSGVPLRREPTELERAHGQQVAELMRTALRP